MRARGAHLLVVAHRLEAYATLGVCPIAESRPDGRHSVDTHTPVKLVGLFPMRGGGTILQLLLPFIGSA
jgi:hypothetical protein